MPGHGEMAPPNGGRRFLGMGYTPATMTTRRQGRRAAGAAAVLLLAAGAGAGWLLTRDATVTVSQAELQRRLAEAFPIQKDYLGVGTLTLSRPVVHLQPGSDRVDFAVDAAADALGGALRAGGAGRLSARVRFVPATRELFLEDTRVESLDIRGLPAQYAGLARQGAGLAAQEYFAARPLLTVERPLWSGPLGRFVVKNAVVEDGALRVTLGREDGPPRPQ